MSVSKSTPDDGDEVAPTATRAKVTLSGVTETLLIPLLGRATDAARQESILGDVYAGRVLEQLEYDFAKLPMPLSHSLAVAMRTRFYDRWTVSFLDRHPRATVIHLACGLDSRNQRVSWSNPDVRWIDVDLPEVVALRRQVLPTSLPDGQDYRLLGADVTSDGWLQEVPRDRPVLVIMEGLVSYLKEEQGKKLLGQLADTFEEGELHFECMTASIMAATNKRENDAVSKTGTKFQWAVDDPKDLEKIHPRLRILEAARYVDLASRTSEFPFASRASFWAMSWVPSIREGIKFVRFEVISERKLKS
ncbi:polyketide synthesis O-methyltransferase [Xylariaceae sp. FL0255]|nr:polyketide synthesis O-methyltransferase [Xylariaceae sp. FL0255]